MLKDESKREACSACGAEYDEYMGATMHANNCAAWGRLSPPAQAEASTLPGDFREWLGFSLRQARYNNDAIDPKAAEIIANVLARYDAARATPPTTPAVESGEVRRFNNPEVGALAVVLFEAFKRAEPEEGISKYPASYMATFADMAHAVLSRPAVESESGDRGADVQAIYSAIHNYVPVELHDGKCLGSVMRLNGHDRIKLVHVILAAIDGETT